jgi:hypothetical protein
MAHEIHTDIEIAATPERVWAILTDFAAYPQWNPFIRSIEGQPERGATLKVRIQASGAKAMTFRPTVLVAEPGRELRWLGRLLVSGLFDGEHRFVIQPSPAGTVRFEQGERFTGLLVGFLQRSLDQDVKRGFREMNLALKRRVEG